MSRRRAKSPLSRAQKCMNVLGWFHYACAILTALFIALIFLAGVGRFGAELQKSTSPTLEFLKPYDGMVAGVSMIVILVIGLIIESFLGWSCRRKARRPEKITLTIVLSGAQTLFSIVSILRQGFANVYWLDAGYTLALNVVTFSLALWMKAEYRRRLRSGEP